MPTGHYQRKPRAKRIIFHCEVCGKDILITNGLLKSRGSNPRFCSKKCNGIGAVRPEAHVVVKCDYCGKEFSKLKVRMKKNNYCSAKCSGGAKKVAGAKWRDTSYIRKYMRDYYNRNKETISLQNREWATNNKKLRLDIQKKYRDKNREKIIATNHYRRRPEAGRISHRRLVRIMTSARGVCQYCGGIFEKLTVDHIVPMSAGGLNRIDNIMPCCKSCNSSKNAKNPEDWIYEKHGIAGLIRAVWFLEKGETIPNDLVESAHGIKVEIIRNP